MTCIHMCYNICVPHVPVVCSTTVAESSSATLRTLLIGPRTRPRAPIAQDFIICDFFFFLFRPLSRPFAKIMQAHGHVICPRAHRRPFCPQHLSSLKGLSFCCQLNTSKFSSLFLLFYNFTTASEPNNVLPVNMSWPFLI